MKLAQLNTVTAISEDSLNRLLSHSKQPFAIISAYRQVYDRNENIERNRQLRSIFNGHKFGVHQLIGHWRECADPTVPYDQCPIDKLKDVIERSYFVPKPPAVDNDTFINLIMDAAQKFEQDGFIYSNGSEVAFISRDGQTIPLGGMNLNKIGQAFSKHIKKQNVPFVFEGIEVPTTNIGRIGRQKMGFLPVRTDDRVVDLVVESVN